MRAISITYALGVTALALSACSNQGASERGDKTSVLAGRVEAGPVNYEVQTLAEGLDHPWSLAFLPDGNMLVTERTGQLLLVGPDGSEKTIKDFNESADLPTVVHGDGMQAGLFDVVLHPQFAENSQVYISYTANVGGGENTLLLLRFTYTDGALSRGEELFRASPASLCGA